MLQVTVHSRDLDYIGYDGPANTENLLVVYQKVTQRDHSNT